MGPQGPPAVKTQTSLNVAPNHVEYPLLGFIANRWVDSVEPYDLSDQLRTVTRRQDYPANTDCVCFSQCPSPGRKRPGSSCKALRAIFSPRRGLRWL